LRRAIADYLEHERAEVARINAALAEATPFKATDDDA
jgi:predicted N-acyltransferase